MHTEIEKGKMGFVTEGCGCCSDDITTKESAFKNAVDNYKEIVIAARHFGFNVEDVIADGAIDMIPNLM